jgi:hypothetical protein
MKLFTIGCSFTEGQGLKKQAIECYSNCLAQTLKLEHYNFGGAGFSNDYIFRKIFELLNDNIITKEDIIIIQWTHYTRKELPVSYKDKMFYHSLPTSPWAYQDKSLVTLSTELNATVNDQYINNNVDDIQKKLTADNEKFLNTYNTKFLNENYQLNTTKNYINSLYAYLEYYGYKHLHFFGWDSCVIESVFDNKPNFIKETFAGHTNTKFSEHPNKKSHNEWGNFLTEKIIKFSFIDNFETQINNYRKNLSKLKVEIEDEIPNLFKNRMNKLKIAIETEIDITNTKIKNKKELELNKQLEKIKKQKELELEEQLKWKKIELENIEKHLKEKELELQNIQTPTKKIKTLI